MLLVQSHRQVELEVKPVSAFPGWPDPERSCLVRVIPAGRQRLGNGSELYLD